MKEKKFIGKFEVHRVHLQYNPEFSGEVYGWYSDGNREYYSADPKIQSKLVHYSGKARIVVKNEIELVRVAPLRSRRLVHR